MQGVNPHPHMTSAAGWPGNNALIENSTSVRLQQFARANSGFCSLLSSPTSDCASMSQYLPTPSHLHAHQRSDCSTASARPSQLQWSEVLSALHAHRCSNVEHNALTTASFDSRPHQGQSMARTPHFAA
jgi:hypothetical protein